MWSLENCPNSVNCIYVYIWAWMSSVSVVYKSPGETKHNWLLLSCHSILLLKNTYIYCLFICFPIGWSEWLDWRTRICRKWGESQCSLWNFGDKLWRRSWQRHPQGEATNIQLKKKIIFLIFLLCQPDRKISDGR